MWCSHEVADKKNAVKMSNRLSSVFRLRSDEAAWYRALLEISWLGILDSVVFLIGLYYIGCLLCHSCAVFSDLCKWSSSSKRELSLSLSMKTKQLNVAKRLMILPIRNVEDDIGLPEYLKQSKKTKIQSKLLNEQIKINPLQKRKETHAKCSCLPSS